MVQAVVLAVCILAALMLPAAGAVPAERFAEDLAQAQSLLDHGKYEDAIIVLERLLSDQPGDQRVPELLQRAYQRAGRFADLLDFLLARLPRSASRTADLITIADCRFKLGTLGMAESTLTILLTPPPEDPEIYRQVAQTYRANGRNLQAEDTYLRARQRFGKPTLFSRELADLYEARREYAKAIQEYFIDLQENPRGLSIVRQRIAAIARMEEGTAELTLALQQIVAKNPASFLAHRLYADLLLESGNAEAAWPEYLAADKLAEDPAEHILYFIHRCLENKYFEPARRACLTFFERYPGNAGAVDVQLAYASVLVGLGKPDSAIMALHHIAALFEQPELRAEISCEIGNIYFEQKNLLDSAEAYYRRTLEHGRRREELVNASVRLGDCRVRRGDLAGADSVYSDCVKLRLSNEQQELVAFKRAELLFFTDQYDSLVGTLKSLIAAHPRGYFVNDAVALSLRITENREPLDWSLKRFSAAALLERQGKWDSAQARFGELAADSANGLADDALFELGRLYTRIGLADSAAVMYGRLIERYPGRPLVPAALTELGAIYAAQTGKAETARAAFRRVLTEFADSPYLEEARRRLKDVDRRRPGS